MAEKCMRLDHIVILILFVMIIITAGCVQPSPSQPDRTPTPYGTPISPAPSGTWTFVVFGDSRDNTKDTLTGVSPYLDPVAVAIAAEKPDLVMYNGDLVSGWILSLIHI